MNWISIKDKRPTEADELILVCCEGKSYIEIVYVCDEENRLKKPFAYDEHDTPVWSLNDITHWIKLVPPSVG